MEGDSFSIDSDYDRYIEDKNFHYEEFAKRKTKDIEVFRAQVRLTFSFQFFLLCCLTAAVVH